MEADLQGIPNEIVLDICTILSRPGLLAFSKTSKRLHLAAEPFLYAEFIQSNTSATPLLLRTLLEQPHLGLHFKSLEFTWRNGYMEVGADSNNFPLLTKHYHSAIMSHMSHYFGLLEQDADTQSNYVNSWFSDIFERDDQVGLNIFLLLLVPRVKSIVFNGGYQWNSHLHRFLSTVGSLQSGPYSTAPGALPALRNLSFRMIIHRPQLPQKPIWDLMRIPSLRTFYWEDLTSRRDQLQDTPLNTTFHLQSITLRHCEPVTSELEGILPQFQALRKLHIECIKGHDLHFLSLTQLLKSLEHVRICLEELTVLNFSRDPLNVGEMPSLSLFQKLRSFTIESRLLKHHRTGSTPEDFDCFRFDEVLPSSLEYLRICNADHVTPRRLLQANIDQRHAVPNLKQVIVDFTYHNEALVDRWKQLEIALAKNGIGLKLRTIQNVRDLQ